MARAKAASRGRTRRGSRKRSAAEPQDAVVAVPADELEGEADADLESSDESEALVDAEPDGDDSLEADAIDDSDLDGDDYVEDGEDLSAAELLLRDKQGSARDLAIRRAIEERREARRLREDLDYLDFDD